jgi:hypothetical protein
MAHGDAEHRVWLAEKCNEVANEIKPKIEAVLAAIREN